MAQDLADLSFDLSLRGLSQQERVLDELRVRSGTLLAAASLVASFLDGRAKPSTVSFAAFKRPASFVFWRPSYGQFH